MTLQRPARSNSTFSGETELESEAPPRVPSGVREVVFCPD
jgi:hypothetical protein